MKNLHYFMAFFTRNDLFGWVRVARHFECDGYESIGK